MTPSTTLDRRYLLVMPIPYFVDDVGDVWVDRLWKHDLDRHLAYLPQLTLTAPCARRTDQPDLVRFEVPDGMKLLPLPYTETMGRALALLPWTAVLLYRAVRANEIIHSGAVGWPYPIGWLANLFASLSRRSLVVVVESAPWRSTGEENSWKRRLRRRIYEKLARWSCRRADVALFTQPAYRDSLFGGRGAAYVTPATWMNADDIVPQTVAESRWARRVEEPVRLLFAGRLDADKGVRVLLDAVRASDAEGRRVAVDIIGSGPLREACEQTSRSLRTSSIRVLDPVPYGAAFFSLLDDYHAVVIPSVTDEQPRIVFDAHARAVPIIAAATDGLRPHVTTGERRYLVTPGDPLALREAFERAMTNPEELRELGMAGRTSVLELTHEAMHRNRLDILLRHFGAAEAVG